jgi:ATP-dependent Clp endopeptidase proteolytic subunit ClpP
MATRAMPSRRVNPPPRIRAPTEIRMRNRTTIDLSAALLALAATCSNGPIRADAKNRKTIPLRNAGAVMAKGDWYEIRAAGEDTAELLIYGDIGESWFGESVTAANLVKELQGIQAKTINVRINSYGGTVSDGIAIYNALRRHDAEIHTFVDGVAMSIASLIAMAGDTVTMAANAIFMVHAPWGGATGNAAELRKYADTLDKFADAMTSAYIAQVGDEKKTEINDLLKDGQDHYYTAEEAKTFGFVDDITESLAVAASVPSRYQGQPAATGRNLKECINMNWKQIAKALGMAETATVEQIKAKLAELGLTGETVTVAQVEAALQPAGETVEQVQARITARNRDIRAAFAPFRSREGVADLEIEVVADTALSVKDASDKLLKLLGKDTSSLAANGRVEAGETDTEKQVNAASNALLLRAGVRQDPKSKKEITVDGANPYRGLTLVELARAALQRAGVNTAGMDGLQVAKAALGLSRVRGAGQSTSDFPVFLENTLHKLVLQGFQAITPSYPRFCKLGDVSDFRSWRRIVPGMLGNLDAVNEAGEYKMKALPDGEKESISVTRRGNIIRVTPETLVNDDLGQVADSARGLGMAGQRAIDRAVFALLAQNSNLGPTLVKTNQTVIHASHGNSGTGAVSVAALSTLYQKMAKQTFPGADAEIMDLVPRIAVANTVVAGDLRVHNDSQYDPASSNLKPNKVRGTLTDIVGTERMPATIYYLFADPNVAPVIEVVFLNGQREVRVVQDEEFSTGGLAWRGELPFGVGAIDYRGIVYSTGA